MSVINVSYENFNEIKNSNKTILLDFYADWCGHCRVIAPTIQQIADENPNYIIGKINVDNEPELAQSFEVSSIPLLVVIKDGKITNQSVGAKTKQQILDMIED